MPRCIFVFAFLVGRLAAKCIGESCPAQGDSMIQHHVAKKSQTNPYSYGHDNTQSCGYQKERIETSTECREAAGALDMNFGSSGAYYRWPAYCFRYNSIIYFNSDVAGSAGRNQAFLVCKSTATTTTTTTTTTSNDVNEVNYTIGLPGYIDCTEGHVVSTHGECASSALISAVGVGFANWVSTHDRQFGCLYNVNTDSLFFNYFQGGTADNSFSPVCKTETNPVIKNFDVGDFDTNVCRFGNPIDDPEDCREAAVSLGEIFSTEGNYAGYPTGCFHFSNSDIYYNRNTGNQANPNAAPICLMG